MKHLNILLLCLLIPAIAMAEGGVKFFEKSWDFGTIKEEGGNVSHTFSFENLGKEPLVVLKVSTSCGCTSPIYSKRPIAAGELSQIEISFDPEYRPGPFTKSIDVYTSSSQEPIKLTIHGTVTPRKLTIAEEFPYSIGSGLLATRLYMAIGQIDHEEYRKSLIELYNPTDRTITLEMRPTLESGFLHYVAPKKIEPGVRAKLHAGYRIGIESGYYGKLNDELQFVVDGEPSPMILKIRAFTVERADE